jgi:hypothetical protein
VGLGLRGDDLNSIDDQEVISGSSSHSKVGRDAHGSEGRREHLFLIEAVEWLQSTLEDALRGL